MVTEVAGPTVEKRSRRWISLAAVLLVVFALVGMLAYGQINKSSATGLQLAGKTAPDFTLNLFDGGTLTMSQLVGKPVFVNLWASWCGPCKDEAPALEQVSREYKGRVTFVGVDVQDNDSDARAFIKQFGIDYPNGPDSTNRISVNYGLTGVPESTFVKADGTVARHIAGPLTASQLRGYIEDLLK